MFHVKHLFIYLFIHLFRNSAGRLGKRLDGVLFVVRERFFLIEMRWRDMLLIGKDLRWIMFHVKHCGKNIPGRTPDSEKHPRLSLWLRKAKSSRRSLCAFGRTGVKFALCGYVGAFLVYGVLSSEAAAVWVGS